jgi:hypothetical protein
MIAKRGGTAPKGCVLFSGWKGVSPPGPWIYEVQGEKDGAYDLASDVFLAPAGDVSQQLLQVQTGYQLLPDSGIALNFNVGEL